MACYSPLQGWQSRDRTSKGRHRLTFNKRESNTIPMTVPCGQCIGCRLEYSRQWAIRCAHEAQMHTNNSFITLTYNPENLPPDGSLNLRHFQKFIKRLRKKLSPIKIRFYHCGEYGYELGRPHYHACIFGYDFTDKRFFKESNGSKLYTSDILEKTWGKGFCLIGDVTFESAAYVARYITKKITGAAADSHYLGKVNKQTGEIYPLKPEYVTMSRKPGIGTTWYEKYQTDVYPSDSIIIKGKETLPPRFYDTMYEIQNPEGYIKLKANRKQKQNKQDNTPERLKTRQTVKLAQTKQLTRSYEDQ